MYTVTRDINVDLKRLKKLAKKGLIRIVNIRIENNSSINSAILPTAIFDQTLFGQSRFGSAEQSDNFEKLKRIIGLKNIKDCIHLEAHIRDKYDYFVTEDDDVLGKRLLLEKEFPGLKIRNLVELESELLRTAQPSTPKP